MSLEIGGVFASRLQEANVKLKSCLSCESERLEMAWCTETKHLENLDGQHVKKSRENSRHKKLFHHDGMP